MGNRITRCFRHGLAMNLAAPPRNPTISIVEGVKPNSSAISGTDIPFARSFPIFSDVSSDQAPAVISILRTFCNEMPARLAMVLLGIPCSWSRRTVCIVASILSVPCRYRFLYCPNCCTLIIQQSNKIVQKAKVPSFATDSSVRNDIENTLILFRCNIPISRLCSANCGLDSYQSLRAECFIYSCKALVRKFTESVRKSNGRILLKGTNPSANVTISKVSDCS